MNATRSARFTFQLFADFFHKTVVRKVLTDLRHVSLPSKEDLHAAWLCLVIRMANYRPLKPMLKGKSQIAKRGRSEERPFPDQANSFI
jgi:hypothetical protein